jgi:2,3-bisphosphoglycerate-dependent phosphoglycerate mutase
MRLYLIRHAQSENNQLWELSKSSLGRNEDPAITALGRQQAGRLAEHLCDSRQETAPDWQNAGRTGFGITHLYSSLMLRALQTASAISQTLGLPIIGRDDLFECGGIYLDDEESGERVGQPGRTLGQLGDQFPDLILPAEDLDRGWWNRPYETREERLPRARRVVQSLFDLHKETADIVAVVTHAAFCNALLTVLLGLPDGHNHWFILNNTAITSVDIWPDGIGVNYTNRTDFLPPDLVS